MVDIKDLKEENTYSFEVVSEDVKSLLYDFLDEIIFLKDADNVLFREFNVKIEKKKDWLELSCKATGQDIGDLSGGDVKAVTYSDMVVSEENGYFILQVVLDM